MPTVEEVYTMEQVAHENFIAKNEHDCLNCFHAALAEDGAVSRTFPEKLYGQIGYCIERYEFITSDDTDISQDCEHWE